MHASDASFRHECVFGGPALQGSELCGFPYWNRASSVSGMDVRCREFYLPALSLAIRRTVLPGQSASLNGDVEDYRRRPRDRSQRAEPAWQHIRVGFGEL
jgi:hypothetical protein